MDLIDSWDVRNLGFTQSLSKTKLNENRINKYFYYFIFQVDSLQEDSKENQILKNLFFRNFVFEEDRFCVSSWKIKLKNCTESDF